MKSKQTINYPPLLILGATFLPTGVAFLPLGLLMKSGVIGEAGATLFGILGLGFEAIGLTFLLVGIAGYFQQKRK